MVYLDVDAVCKLAHWNVLPLLPKLLQNTWEEMATISSLRFRVDRAKLQPDGRLFQSTSAAEIASACIEKLTSPGIPPAEILAQLVDIPQIDPGEAVLLALVAEDPKGRFLTGDKRALHALAKCAIAGLFAGKIICIEQILDVSLRLKGRDWFLLNVCPQRKIDKAISMILGSQCDASIENLNLGIESYIGELNGLCAPSLLLKFHSH
jgi:hypothetical protein